MPANFRDSGLVQILEATGADEVVDDGDIELLKSEIEKTHPDESDKLRDLGFVAAMCEKLAKKVHDRVEEGFSVVSIAGEHYSALGSISGASVALDGDLGVVWIDGDFDSNTPETTLTGDIHGMPAAALLGRGHHDLVNLLKDGRKVDPKNIIFVGIDRPDDAEVELMEKLGVMVFYTNDLRKSGNIGQVTDAIDDLRGRLKNPGHLWVSLDTDGIYKGDAPATPMPNEGGVRGDEIREIARHIGRTGGIVGVDVVEFSSGDDVDDKTLNLLLNLITL